ncbi:cyclase family protein [Candidatus Dependentiae bacterium]|nr:cyclase family protein [Candidatus Dependentiae bacterium]
MEILDISWPISENITEYKNRKTVELKNIKNYQKDGVSETMIKFHSHTGTHVDACEHFLGNKKTVDQIDLQNLIGKCKVLDFITLEEDKITKSDLEKFEINKNDIILLKTKNSEFNPTDKFNPNFVYLDKSGAQFLADKKIKCVGIDYLGIERNQTNHETHKILLQNNIPIIEGLRLKNAIKKEYTLYCLPILIQVIDAAPARAILV